MYFQRFLRCCWYWSWRLLLWKWKERPARMHWNGRAIVNDFEQTEKLYMRCQIDWVGENKQLKPAKVRFPNQSVNRERFSKEYDVLLDSPDGEPRKFIYW